MNLPVVCDLCTGLRSVGIQEPDTHCSLFACFPRTFYMIQKIKMKAILDKRIAVFIQWIIMPVTGSVALCLHKGKTLARDRRFPRSLSLSLLHVQLLCLTAISVTQHTEWRLALHIIPKLL